MRIIRKPLLAAALALAGCSGQSAPDAPGVCWRATPPEGPFRPVSTQVASLDDCAAQLESFHLLGAARVEGAFQGYFIFIDDARVSSSSSRKGFGYPIFQPGQRAEIDADLRSLIADRNGALPSASDIAVERR